MVFGTNRLFVKSLFGLFSPKNKENTKFEIQENFQLLNSFNVFLVFHVIDVESYFFDGIFRHKTFNVNIITLNIFQFIILINDLCGFVTNQTSRLN